MWAKAGCHLGTFGATARVKCLNEIGLDHRLKGRRREWSAKPAVALIVFNQIFESDFVSLHNRPANRICHNGAAAS